MLGLLEPLSVSIPGQLFSFDSKGPMLWDQMYQIHCYTGDGSWPSEQLKHSTANHKIAGLIPIMA